MKLFQKKNKITKLKLINTCIVALMDGEGIDEDEVLELVSIRKEYLTQVSKKNLNAEVERLGKYIQATNNSLKLSIWAEMLKDTVNELKDRTARGRANTKFAIEQTVELGGKVIPAVIHEATTKALIDKGYELELAEEDPVIPSKPLQRVFGRLK